jgi:hypothetical protein
VGAAAAAPAMVCGGGVVCGEEPVHYFLKKYLRFFS